jgi:hypothetical protein
VGLQYIYKQGYNQANLLKVLKETGKLIKEMDRRIIGNKEDKLILRV